MLTNSHVINESADHLRVRFGQGRVVKATVLVNDREHDIAVLRVNLENIGKFKVLSIFVPMGEDLVQVGEQVIAVGSPTDRLNLENTMTLGVIGKCDKGVLNHDANIAGGNSGGPLFNYDGEVVGINTYVMNAGVGHGASGAVPITLALSDIAEAQAKLSTTPAPSSELLPDVSSVPYPIANLLRQEPQFFQNRKQKDYNFDSAYFSISVFTPPQGYHQVMQMQEERLKKRKKRAEKKNFAVTDDEYGYKNQSYYNYERPVVTIDVIPKPKLTTGSKVANTVGFLAATTATLATAGIAAPLMAMPFFYGKKEIKKDFLQLSLVSSDGEPVATPLETGRRPFEWETAVTTGYSYEELIDKSYFGRYTFDAQCFNTDKKLKLIIDVEGKDRDLSVDFPDKVKALIVQDFEPYWRHLAKSEQGTKAVAGKVTISGPNL